MTTQAVQDDGNMGVLVGVDPQDGLAVDEHAEPLTDVHGRGARWGSDRTLTMLGQGPYWVTIPTPRLEAWTPDQKVD